ncbi:MAG: hypothetical protein ABI411_05225 [Tahibacter sp.]
MHTLHMSILQPIATGVPAPGAAAFTDLAAVQAWDAWFRWREGDDLHDTSIDATWRRVANALGSVESTQQSAWAHRFHECFSTWSLLPDERVIAHAGTGRIEWNHALASAINLAVLVRNPISDNAQFDFHHFGEIATLSVRALDNAVLIAERHGTDPLSLSIGLIGLADALALLDIPYASHAALGFAARIGECLKTATSKASTELTAERGALASARNRYQKLTGLQSHPRLSLLANNVSDAIAPLPAPFLPVRVDAHSRPVVTNGYAMEYAHRAGHVAQIGEMRAKASGSPATTRALQNALAPYFDVVRL